MTKNATTASAESNNFEFEVSTVSSGELYDDITIEKAVEKGKSTEKVKGKKVVPQESDSSLKGPWRKNTTTSPLHTPQPANEDDDEAESSSTKEISKEAQSLEEVDTTPIDRQDPPLALTTTPVPIV